VRVGAIRAAERRRDKVLAVRDRMAQRAAGATGYARAGADRAKRSIDSQLARAERAVEIHRRAAANHLRRVERARQDGTRAGHQAHADAALERMARAQQRLEDLEGCARRGAAGVPAGGAEGAAAGGGRAAGAGPG
jgi:hypothetical protein